MSAGGDFRVMVSRKEMVAAVLPMQEHWLPLSNLDLLLPPVDVGVFFCYRRPAAVAGNGAFGTMVSVLKKSLAQALVSFYAFAGEVVQNSVGEPELLCNNRGVEFVEAAADVELRHLNLYNPDESIEGKLVPKKKQGVLTVQATELKCGGLVVACTFDHRIADAYSANMFFVAWADMARSEPTSLLPSFRRSLVNPRRPGYYDPFVDAMYAPISALPPPKDPPSPPVDHLISRIYYVPADEINRLQSIASAGNSNRRTKLESFSAFLWKLVAESSSSFSGRDKKMCKMGIVVDGRARLMDGNEKSPMAVYFGNVLSIPFGAQRIEELKDRPLSAVAGAVREFLKAAGTKEHFLGLVDWVEAHRPEPALARIYSSGSEDGPAFVVSSGQRFPVERIDFGWGGCVFGSYHFPWGGDAGYVMPMPSPRREGDWIVYAHLLKGQLEVIETRAADVLRPLTTDYLGLT
ncbi:coniferyl alcohol acyltransferase [Malania oleifera]|uniref:coniferyl alcohol acyltransferase n=1 Tax=Malania oleifera TaxID=397392 RepID=UPI0025ADA6AD|nr:coniferyl alcohol acyltransferase [Malania oleifera]